MADDLEMQVETLQKQLSQSQENKALEDQLKSELKQAKTEGDSHRATIERQE